MAGPSDGAAWAVVAAVSAAGVLAGLVAARVVAARAARSLPDEIVARCNAVHAARHYVQYAAIFPAMLAPVAAVASVRILLDADFPMDAAPPLFLAAGVLASLSSVSVILDLEESLHGPGWSRRATANLWIAASLADLWPFVGAVAAAGAVAAWGGGTSDPLIAANGFMLGSLACVVASGVAHSRIGAAAEFPADVAGEAAARDGGLAFPSVVLRRTGGHGAWYAATLGSWRRNWIVVTEDVLERLTRPQMVAVLLHEAGHARLRHVVTRKALLLTAILVPPLCFATGDVARPVLVGMVSYAISRVGGRLLYRRQELAADAYAAARAPAEDLGRALVALERAKLVPSDRPIAISHPALRTRLTAMGLDADAFLTGSGAAA